MANRGGDPDPLRARVRVMVVDDSALMRRLLCDLLNSAPEIEVVGTAKNGREAVLQAVRLRPDVITLDVEMPEVSGLEALPLLLAAHEAPVVMVSALTQAGADVTLQALELGAVDFMPKPERNQLAELRAGSELLIAKVLTAAQSRVRRPRRPAASPPPASPSRSPRTGSTLSHPSSPAQNDDRPDDGPGKPTEAQSADPAPPLPGQPCILIGISTGGPQALSQVLPRLSPPVPPILVVQHMPAQFTGVFSARLNRSCELLVKEAADGFPVLMNQVLVAPGGRHMTLCGHHPRLRVTLSDEVPVSGHKPSVDVLFRSAAQVLQGAAIGILMTGMGRDGVEGCKAILAAGGFTAGQDEPTSVVYGMNKAAWLEGALKAQFAIDELPSILRDIRSYRDRFEHGR